MRKLLTNRFAIYKKFYKSDLIFFFPQYGIGGGERVHINILESIKGNKKMVFFEIDCQTDENFLFEFEQEIDFYCVISKYKRNKITFFCFLIPFYLISVFKKTSLLFGSNSSLYYWVKLIKLNSRIKYVDLIHTFDSSMEFFIKNHNKINKLNRFNRNDLRIFISNKSKTDFENYYKHLPYKNGIVVLNCVKEFSIKKRDRKNINCLFIGRPDNHSKRINLLAKVINKIYLSTSIIERPSFTVVGFNKSDLTFLDRETLNMFHKTNFLGPVFELKNVMKLYSESDIILITSKYEGFPMVLMEAMAHGVIPICTNVGGISEHVKHNVNGYLVEDKEEQQIVNEMSDFIIELNNDKFKRNSMSLESYQYALENFTFEKFSKAYNEVLKIN
jgi:glycosyltransferase involved in cell wall biosynthesis